MAKTVNRVSGITVRGFKSICTEQHIEVKPLTILAGANSSGKSSIIQPLLLLKQTLEAPGDPGALLLTGSNVRFSSADQLLSRTSGKDCSKDFMIRIELVDKQSLELLFRREEGTGFQVDQMIYSDGKERIQITPNMSHEEILGVLPDPMKSFHKRFVKGEEGKFRWNVTRDRCFLSFELARAEGPKRTLSFGPYSISPSTMFTPHIQNLIHLPGLRGNPRRTYPKAVGGPQFQGTFEPYVASVVAQWQSGNDNRLREVALALREMGLTWKVEAKAVDDTQVELRVGRLSRSKRGGATDLVNIADVGFGVSQVLPVVVALVAARPGQLVYLEQPEIHLHPLAQRRLASVLCSAIGQGVVAIVETHSALLLREVQTLVATNQLARDMVKLHWVQRGADGASTVVAADLDENGAYGDWPEDFDQTELEAEKEYLDAVEANGAGA